MTPFVWPRSYRQQIDREPSPLLAASLPWASIILLSVLGAGSAVASAPLLPPLAFTALLAWRLLRPGMLPVWAGLPLGAVDDLYSGQPMGSGIVLWSAAMLAIDVADRRLRWRGFYHDWALGAVLIVVYLVAAGLIAGVVEDGRWYPPFAPQMVLATSVFPVIAMFVAMLDRVRLLPLRSG